MAKANLPALPYSGMVPSFPDHDLYADERQGRYVVADQIEATPNDAAT